MIIYLAADLLWATKIKSTADALGIPARPARTAQMLTDRLADSPVTAVLLDLDAGPVAFELLGIAVATRAAGGREASAMQESAGEPKSVDGRAKGLRICCFGPHVQAAELMQARQAGADSVMARGALHANLPAILTALHQGRSVGSQIHD